MEKESVRELIQGIIRCKSFIRTNRMLVITMLAAAVTSGIVRPDKEYFGYFDLKTLSCLFCMLAVVGALRNIHFFTALSQRLMNFIGNIRTGIMLLVLITLLGSLFITNDMALITFLPLSFFVLSSANQQKHLAFTFIMQNMAANLGGMLTPFGNPQNLYLYNRYQIPAGEFLWIMLPPFLVSAGLIFLCCLFVKPDPISVKPVVQPLEHPGKAAAYFSLFLLSIAVVFRVFPYYGGLAIVVAALLILDRKALKTVDYPLILTFMGFFIFSGNMARIEGVRCLFSALLDKSTILVGTLTCQIISNVPAAVLLSQFTDHYRELLVSVNIGGAGTLIASLASLITYREYAKAEPLKIRRYLAEFTAYNFGFLFVLLVFTYLLT